MAVPRLSSPSRLIGVPLKSTSSIMEVGKFMKSKLNFPLASGWNHSVCPANLDPNRKELSEHIITHAMADCHNNRKKESSQWQNLKYKHILQIQYIP